MKYILGLTGQSGSGKSSLHTEAARLGFFVIDCDKVAHAVLETERAAAALEKAFGSSVLENGRVSRKLLAAAAFKSKENTEKLNSTVLPMVLEEINKIIKGCGSNKVLLDAPTLYESGADKLCSAVIAVLCDRNARKNRIIERDNLSADAAELRLSAEKSDEY